jgi:acyl-CoA thioester hydrolase
VREKFKFFNTMRVRYSEIDGQGIVFNAHYLTYLDVSFMEYFRSLGLDYKELAKEGKLDMALVKSTLEFKAPAFYDDLLEIGVRVSTFGNTSYTVDFVIFRSGSDELIFKAQSIYVNYNAHTRSAERVPEFFRSLVESYEGEI